jgi:glucose/arabinose dehydrogenase
VLSVVDVLRAATPAAAAVPSGFTEVTAFSGLVNPTAIRFAPDGRIFVAEKRGTIQMFGGPGDPVPTQIADLRTEVYNFWDRGLMGLALDPDFPTRPYLYAVYTFDGLIGGTAPRWGTPDTDSDPCPTPPGATTNGCVASGKLVRLTLNPDGTTTKTDLINDWCQQFPSHSLDDVVFGRDGALYVSAGESGNFNAVDYGQFGDPVNPCGDPANEGGSLRSQDLRTTTDPVGLDGTVIRVSPDTGQALPDNPNASAGDPNARRIVAYGLRNPFRLLQRPGTDELWIADVGQVTWEEIDRITSPTASVRNFGWPCYEGAGRNPAFDAVDLPLCENLYAQGGVDGPYFTYRHGAALSGTDTCATAGGASVSGLSFEFYAGGPYPAQYDGALFFADYTRNCIWVMTRGTNGLPDPASVTSFVSPAAAPVDLQLSPQGELWYADFAGGTVRRIVWTGSTPVTCPAGQYRAEYFANTTLTGAAASTACEPAPLAHDWVMGSPAGVGPDNFSARWSGTFPFAAGSYTFTAVADDGIRVWVDGEPVIDEWRVQAATTFTATRTLTAGDHAVRVEWYDATREAVAKLDWAAVGGNGPRRCPRSPPPPPGRPGGSATRSPSPARPPIPRTASCRRARCRGRWCCSTAPRPATPTSCGPGPASPAGRSPRPTTSTPRTSSSG